MISGYKCFDKGLINRYGKEFQVGMIYHTDGDIRFGLDGNGFHFCLNLEDTLRFFDCKKEIEICEVIGFGEIISRSDEYNGYFDMYVCESIYIKKLLTREEIINYVLSLNELRVQRFISCFSLTIEEIDLFFNKFANSSYVIDAINYYQKLDREVYKKRLLKS